MPVKWPAIVLFAFCLPMCAAMSEQPKNPPAVQQKPDRADEKTQPALPPIRVVAEIPEESGLAFKVEDDTLSLRHLPPTVNKIADAAVALLYGYKHLLNVEEVPVMRLNESVRRSGLNMQRLDREIGPNLTLIRKGGQRNGARFSLNNQGLKMAEQWLRDWTTE